MKLEWMGEYRDIVEALIHYCNRYAAAYKAEKMELFGINFSFAQIQVLEYLLENEDLCQNMSQIAERLGISRSNFTKIVSRLEAKGLVEKQPVEKNRRELQVCVNDMGRKLYSEYSSKILETHFSFMFDSLKEIPPEYRKAVSMALKTPFLPQQK
jgi:DNA-binding MarR family transcriptional regulator